jgi:hypothetical protein
MSSASRATGLPASAIALRWAAMAHFASLLAQVWLAPIFLYGSASAFAVHSLNANFLLALAVLQALLAIANGPRRTGLALTLIAVVLAGLEAVQIWLGKTAHVELHALAGFAIWSLGIAFTVKVCAPNWMEQPRAA